MQHYTMSYETGNVSYHEPPQRYYEWPKGTSNISGDEWHATVAVASGVMPLLHRYVLKILQKM